MKRVFAFILAMALIVSLGVTANAAYADYNTINKAGEIIKVGGDGVITVTNATVDTEYTVYKIFDATPNIVKEMVGGVEVEVVDGVVYTLDPASAAYTVLFGTGAPTNEYFDYNTSTRAVTRKTTKTDDKALIAYLQSVVKDPANVNVFPYVEQTAASKTLVFDQLVHGYYLIESGLGAVVTINSNTPTVEVIDKNQIPGTDFKKEVSIKGSGVYGDNNTVNVGDLLTYRITFDATNYTGDQLIKYYEAFDTKGNGIWAEFNSFRVYIDGVPLNNGHYLNHGGVNTNNWGQIGPWDAGLYLDNGTPADPTDDGAFLEQNLDNADWYLVHTGFDSYSILIPWLEGHTIEGTAGSQYLDFPADAASKFDASVTVTIEYDAVVEPNGNVGGDADNLFNEAVLKWTTEKDTTSTTPDIVHTETYGIGILKEDSTTHDNLAGAKFRVWKNYDPATGLYSNEVFVIPTGIDGIYMVDSKDSPGEHVSGEYMLNAREYFEYLRLPDGTHVGGEATPANWVKNQALLDLGDTKTNVVESQVNGKLVVLGLAIGTYYLEEFEAPSGYNALNGPVTVEITESSSTSFDIYAEADGDVADVQVSGGVYNHYEYSVTQQTVVNSKGHELPSTGGQGTIMLITTGTIVAMAFAVLLITQKKMSVYHD